MSRALFAAAFGLTLSVYVSGAAGGTAEPPRIGKPRPAPTNTPDVLPLPPAVIDNSLAIGGDDVKAHEVSSRLNVEVRVNGRGPYRFIVDSGADSSAVGLRIARDLELPLGTPAILNATTGRNMVDRVKIDELTLGPSTIHNLEVPALREVDLGGEGLIGIDALVRQRLMMDFEQRVIKVEDARKPEKFEPGAIVITARLHRGQLILTQVRAANFPLDAIIDTGSEVTIGNLALRDKLIRKNRGHFWTVPATGVTGETVNLQMAIIPSLELGSVTLRDVPIAFADVPPFTMFGLADQPALMLGTDLLETFRRVSLDFRSRKVRFQLRKCDADVVIRTSTVDSFSRLSAAAPDVCRR